MKQQRWVGTHDIKESNGEDISLQAMRSIGCKDRNDEGRWNSGGTNGSNDRDAENHSISTILSISCYDLKKIYKNKK